MKDSSILKWAKRLTGVVQWLSKALSTVLDLTKHSPRETQKANKHMRKCSEPLSGKCT